MIFMSSNLKIGIMELLLEDLDNTYQALVATAHEAKMAATNEESKPENKYDTRGLEASYLAGAQAKRSVELEKAIFSLRSLRLKGFGSSDVIELTALIEVTTDEDQIKHFFLLPYAGGQKVTFKNIDYQVVTPDSPIGLLLKGKKVGDEFNMKIKNSTLSYQVLKIQ